ncbi:MAG: MerR family transcriptional regulator [Candidatus Sumerlaeia bacterium]|nr:MerR family transcriptional regulator [Candidatus Sumerlaeia bacterium]
MNQTPCELPQKLFYRIQEVSRITGVKPYVLRYWEAEFPSLRPEKGPNDQRRYRASDIALIQEIKRLLYEEKFTIAGARRHLDSKGAGVPSEPPSVRHSQTPRKAASDAPAAIQDILNRLRTVRKELIELDAFLAG